MKRPFNRIAEGIVFGKLKRELTLARRECDTTWDYFESKIVLGISFKADISRYRLKYDLIKVKEILSSVFLFKYITERPQWCALLVSTVNI